MYSKVKNWQDLCNTNLDFLQGKQNETFYHLGPINEETNTILNELIQLNSNGFFTTNSQPYVNEPLLFYCMFLYYFVSFCIILYVFISFTQLYGIGGSPVWLSHQAYFKFKFNLIYKGLCLTRT